MSDPAAPRLLLVTGLSGAGKSTVLKVLEDLGWEVVDNLPLALLDAVIDAPVQRSAANRPIAVGIDSRSRGFKPALLVKRMKELREAGGRDMQTLFLDCAGAELERRFSETRRRHPMASFGFARGLPRHADLVFDMRYLRNPHWDAALRPHTGLDPDVAAYIRTDPAYEATVAQIETLLLTLLPRYRAEGKSYVTIAFGCTGGRHRSVHVADRVARTLRAAGHEPTVTHRNLDSAPQDGLEGKPPPASPAPGGQT